MTRPPAIRMNPTRLPPLTKAQEQRVKLFRREFKFYGKVSVRRKGQKPGHMLIVVTMREEERFYQYDRYGDLVDRWTQGQLYVLGSIMTPDPISAIKLNMEDE